jgi:penicillin amidase
MSMKGSKLQSPWGTVQVELKDDWLLGVRGESDMSVFFGQGYGTARLRLWQLDLSRRVASGGLAEILGNGAMRADSFQRRLGLSALAARAAARDSQADASSWQGLQHRHIRAYISGINHALTHHPRTVETLMLRYRVQPFSIEDAYLLSHLKYFINSAWRYEIFHSRIAGRLTSEQHRQLLSTFGDRGGLIPPLDLANSGAYSELVQTALSDALTGLRLLGMDSPDTGSNVFVLAGSRTVSGKPILATDPHMGHVNPCFSLLCELSSDEGLYVAGSHFPGLPGIIAGRNRHAAWGMVGIMADNQDLFWGKLDLDEGWVETATGRQLLSKRQETIKSKSGKVLELDAYDFEHGRLLNHKDGHGLFLRWPALDEPGGDLTLHGLAHCVDWPSFRASLAHFHNCPATVGYADVHGDIGMQVVGLIPRRQADIGSLVLNLAKPEHAWQGYVPYEELPSMRNPREGFCIYSNQFNETLLAGKPSLSNRWHPPTRAIRARELIEARPRHDLDSVQAIQDDKTDLFARRLLAYLLPHLQEVSPLDDWDGDTRDLSRTRLLDAWMSRLLDRLLAGRLKRGQRTLYANLWPGWRWNLLEILQHHSDTWSLEHDYITRIIRETHAEALEATARPIRFWVEYSHTISKPEWLKKILTGRYPYEGGGRETINAIRQDADFLTGSQLGNDSPSTGKAYTFGPAFKLLCDLDERGELRYMANTPASGVPFSCCLNKVLDRWRKGIRCRIFVAEGIDLALARREPH